MRRKKISISFSLEKEILDVLNEEVKKIEPRMSRSYYVESLVLKQLKDKIIEKRKQNKKPE